jgi:hypothetical protein
VYTLPTTGDTNDMLIQLVPTEELTKMVNTSSSKPITYQNISEVFSIDMRPVMME